MRALRIGSLFSGVGGLELGLEWAGVGHAVWQVEIDPFCRSVLERHWPDARRFGDVREVGAGILEPVDLICGGFPCQDISSAGKGAGLAGERSGLWFEFARVIEEMRPRWVVVENVASGAKRWVDQIVAWLEQHGWQTLPIPLSAGDVGAPHLRRRVFVVARSKREQLREQQRGRLRAGRERPTEPGDDGEAWQTSDTNATRLQRSRSAQRPIARKELAGSAWTADSMPQPALRRMDDGVYAELVETENGRLVPRNVIDRWERKERLKALGNAVVPQCAEVIGHVIQELRCAH